VSTFPPDVQAAVTSVWQARHRVARKLGVNGVPACAWEALERFDRAVMLYRVMGGFSSAKTDLLSAAIEATETCDAAAARRVVELRQPNAEGGR
jgi:hypothetical protein